MNENPRPPPNAPENSPPQSATLSPPAAAATGPLLLGVASAIIIVVQASEGMAPRTRALHHLFDAGHWLALASVFAGLVALWLHAVKLERWRIFAERRRLRLLVGLAAVEAVALSVALSILADDLTGQVSRVATPDTSVAWFGGLAFGVSLGVPFAIFGGWLVARPWLRLVGIAIGCAAGCANHFILEADFPGAHLFLAWGAALLISASATGAKLPSWTDRKPARAARFVLLGLSLAGGLVALVKKPPNAVLVAMLRTDGTPLFTYVAQLRASHETPALVRPAATEWFEARDAIKPIPPSAPKLLPDDPIVILMTIDCLRADVVESRRYDATIRTLAELRDKGVHFVHARTTAPSTAVSLAAIFSGRYFSQLYWTRLPSAGMRFVPHEDTSPRMPEILTGAGVTTVTYLGTPNIDGATGIVRGFTEEHVIPKRNDHFVFARELADRMIDRIQSHTKGPLFMYTHFFDAHAPYDSAGVGGTDKERYVREVGRVDTQIGRILAALTAKGLDKKTLLIITADHGEAFGEHRTLYHGVTIYDELVYVPLLFYAPFLRRPRGILQGASLIDLAPTILDLFGQPTPGTYMGQSLVPLLRGDDGVVLTRPIVIDSGRLQQGMVFSDGMKVLRDKRTGTVELFNLRSDPRELHDLYDENATSGEGPSGADQLAALQAFFRAHELEKIGYKIPYRPP